jgi:hypothetical protein
LEPPERCGTPAIVKKINFHYIFQGRKVAKQVQEAFRTTQPLILSPGWGGLEFLISLIQLMMVVLHYWP